MKIGYIKSDNEKMIKSDKKVDVLFIGYKHSEREKLNEAIDCCKDGDIFMVDKLSDIGDTIDEVMAVYDRLSSKGVNIQIMTEEASLVVWMLLLNERQI